MVTTIDEALDKIYSYVDYSMTHAKDISANVFSLDAVRSLAAGLGDPQKSYPVIHVAGTKGKGSVCAMLASALQNAGFRTGLYTSPHLIRFNERIMVDGKMISDEEIVDLTNRISETVSTMKHVSTFEFTTAMAFEYFRDKKVDFAVIETGLGGRLDATNIVEPVLSVITSISLDHTGFLGDTIEKIAAEKGGIIKPKVPVVCGVQPYEQAVTVLKEIAAKNNSPWINVTDRFHFINSRSKNSTDQMIIWRVEDQKLMENWCSADGNTAWSPAVVSIPLKGLHQIQNAAAVFAAINKIKSRYNQLDLEKAYSGIGKAFWPCRFETLCAEDPLIADGAHNINSIQNLIQTLEKNEGTKEIVCIFGASEDKQLKEMISALAPHVDRFIMTRSTHPRAADPKLLSKLASEAGRRNRIAKTLEEAFSIYEEEKNSNTCFIAAGSLFVAGGIRELYMKNHKNLRYFN